MQRDVCWSAYAGTRLQLFLAGFPMDDIMAIKVIINKSLAGLLLIAAVFNSAVAAEKVDSEVKELSGISIIGNKEAPKSLYIVPWQNSEVGVATSLNSGLLDDSMRPLDKEVFLRELDFYELSHGKNGQ